MSLRVRLVGAHLDVAREHIFTNVGCDILRNIDHHRTRTARAGHKERLADGRREVFHPFHQKVVLHAGPRDSDAVHFLEGVVANQVRRHLPGEDHQRNGIQEGRRDAGDGIGCAGPGGYEHHTGFAGCPRVAIGSMGRTLLVPDQNVFDGVLFVELVVDVKNGPTRISEQELDTFIDERAHEDFRAAKHFSHDYLTMLQQVPRSSPAHQRDPVRGSDRPRRFVGGGSALG